MKILKDLAELGVIELPEKKASSVYKNECNTCGERWINEDDKGYNKAKAEYDNLPIDLGKLKGDKEKILKLLRLMQYHSWKRSEFVQKQVAQAIADNLGELVKEKNE